MPLLPNGLKSRWLIAFCLMSLLPILSEVYLVFYLWRGQGQVENLQLATLAMFFVLCLSFCGYQLARQLVMPILQAGRTVKNISQGKLDDTLDLKGVSELEELSKSLRVISINAKELLEKVDRLAPEDRLTGLYSGGYLRQRLKEEIHRSIYYQRPCSFVYFSIDRFDHYQATHGSAAAEDLLKTTAQILVGYVGPDDRAARIEKDEFAVIFPDKNKKKAIAIMEKMNEDVSKNQSSVRWNLSVGISENPIDGITADELLAKAQQRMRHARASGGIIEAFYGTEVRA